MALTTLSAEKASVLLQEISMLNQANNLLPAKIHRYFQQNQQKLIEATKSFREKIDKLKGKYKMKITPDGKGGHTEEWENDSERDEFNNAVKEILSPEIKVPLMKLKFEDIGLMAVPSKFTFNNFYTYMVDGAPTPDLTEDAEEPTGKVHSMKIEKV